MLVCPLETRPAVGGARQPRPRPQVAAVAGGALELGQHAADDALPRARHNHVRHVQQLRRQDSVIQLELTPKPEGKIIYERMKNIL